MASTNPMDRTEGPKVNKKAKAFFIDDELARLLKTCQARRSRIAAIARSCACWLYSNSEDAIAT
jgi:hypothetical protein